MSQVICRMLRRAMLLNATLKQWTAPIHTKSDTQYRPSLIQSHREPRYNIDLARLRILPQPASSFPTPNLVHMRANKRNENKTNNAKKANAEKRSAIEQGIRQEIWRQPTRTSQQSNDSTIVRKRDQQQEHRKKRKGLK